MALDQTPIDVSQLPVLISGPVLRRLTRNSITVWAVFSTGANVTLHVAASGDASSEEQATVTPLRIGSNLWMAALSLTAQQIDDGQFIANEVYEYWLSSAGWPASRSPVWNETDPLKVGFTYRTGISHPTFVGLPDNLDDFVLVETSCRKPHGNGRDGLRLLDDLMAGQFGAKPRPHVMFLTGDQIYADDVAAPLTPRIRRISEDLIGIDESAFFNGLQLIDGRQNPCESFGLTSGAAANHLWTLGEFLGMYLLAWSDVLWPAILPTWAEATSANAIDPTSNLDETGWNEQRDTVIEYFENLPYIRRILANVPSLMILDDHEITDDWNLTHNWCQTVYGNNQGRRIVVNGLLSYVLCQHWGNKPDLFLQAGSPESNLLGAVAWNAPGTNPDTAAVRTALGIPANVDPPPMALRNLTTGIGLRYDYTLDQNQGYPLDIVVLDERTTREFQTADGPPSRVSQAAIELMIPTPAAPPAVPLLLITPAPVLGLHLIEHYLQPAAALIPGKEAAVDYESWTAFGPSFDKLLQRMENYTQVIILSGDVHYGYGKRLEYERPVGTQKFIGTQFTASSARNPDALTIALHVLGDLTQKLGIVRTRSFDGYSQLTQVQINALAQPPPAGTVLPYDDVVDILLGRIFRQGAVQPSVLPTEVAQSYNLGTPEWRYRIIHYDDEALPSGNDLIAIQTANALNWSGWDPGNSLQMIRGMQASDRNRIGRVFMGLPQFAVVRFSMTGSATVSGDFYLASGKTAQDGGCK